MIKNIHWLLFQRNQIQLPKLTRQLQVQAPDTHYKDAHASQNHTHKTIFFLEAKTRQEPLGLQTRSYLSEKPRK